MLFRSLDRELFMQEQMAADLGLDDAQRTAVEKIIATSREQARPYVKQLVEQRHEMEALHDADTFDEKAVRAATRSTARPGYATRTCHRAGDAVENRRAGVWRRGGGRKTGAPSTRERARNCSSIPARFTVSMRRRKRASHGISHTTDLMRCGEDCHAAEK